MLFSCNCVALSEMEEGRRKQEERNCPVNTFAVQNHRVEFPCEKSPWRVIAFHCLEMVFIRNFAISVNPSYSQITAKWLVNECLSTMRCVKDAPVWMGLIANCHLIQRSFGNFVAIDGTTADKLGWLYEFPHNALNYDFRLALALVRVQVGFLQKQILLLLFLFDSVVVSKLP